MSPFLGQAYPFCTNFPWFCPFFGPSANLPSNGSDGAGTPGGVLIYFPLTWVMMASHFSVGSTLAKPTPLPVWLVSQRVQVEITWPEGFSIPSSSSYPLTVGGLICIHLWGPAPAALPSVPVHHWLSALLQLSVRLKDGPSPPQSQSFWIRLWSCLHGLMGDSLAIWLTQLDKVLLSSACLQSPDVEVGFAQLDISIAPTAAVRGSVAWTRWCHLLRQWHIRFCVFLVVAKSLEVTDSSIFPLILGSWERGEGKGQGQGGERESEGEGETGRERAGRQEGEGGKNYYN